MTKTSGRNWLIALPLMVALLAVGVWVWTQSEGTASEAIDEGELALVTDENRTAIPLDHTDPIPMTVYQSPTCGCCGMWVEHAEENGFEIESHMTADMGTVKEGLAVPRSLASCHTAVVEGYVIEGHVPADDIRRLLAEVPEARGLAVPGMPAGSPGMEAGDRIDRYDVILFNDDGETRVWSSYGTDGL